VGYEYDLRLLRDAGDIRWYWPAHHGLDYGGISLSEYLDDFDSEIRDGLRKGASDAVKAAVNRHHTVTSIGSVASLRIISAESEHAFDIMCVVGGEKLRGDRFHIHTVPPVEATDRERTAYAMVRTIRKRALPDIIFA
jgi:hypothetical protein